MIGSTATLATLGRYHARAFGVNKFAMVYGAGVVGAAASTVLNLRTDSGAAKSGGLGPASALIAYNLFKNPAWFRNFKYSSPALMFGLLILFALYQDDKAMVGGISAGYLALFAL